MASSSVELQFAAEFAVFLVAAAGLAVIVLRSELLSRSSLGAAALGAGFCGVGAAALFRGSLLVRRGADPALVASMAIGLFLLLAGSVRWGGGRAARRLLWLALTLLAAALWLEGLPGPGTWAVPCCWGRGPWPWGPRWYEPVVGPSPPGWCRARLPPCCCWC